MGNIHYKNILGLYKNRLIKSSILFPFSVSARKTNKSISFFLSTRFSLSLLLPRKIMCIRTGLMDFYLRLNGVFLAVCALKYVYSLVGFIIHYPAISFGNYCTAMDLTKVCTRENISRKSRSSPIEFFSLQIFFPFEGDKVLRTKLHWYVKQHFRLL